MNAWFRMYAEFATDPKVQMMSEAMQRRLVMLFCLQSGNGHVTLHETEVAFQLRISMEELADMKTLFVQKGFITDDWKIANWDKRQFRSDSSAERVRAHRNRKKQEGVTSCNVTVTPPDTDTDTESDRVKDGGVGEGDSAAQAPRQIRHRGCRLVENDLPVDWRSFALSEGCRNPEREWQRFRDYWIAQPGAKGVKQDWPATWRNWVRRSADDAKPINAKVPRMPL